MIVDAFHEPVQVSRKHYLDIKRGYPDTVLLFRFGDLYESFNDDAQKVSEVFGVSTCVDTFRDLLVASIDYCDVDSSIAALLKSGQKVAICEQIDTDVSPGTGNRS